MHSRPIARLVALTLAAVLTATLTACARGESPLLVPAPAALAAPAPDSFVVRFETTRGPFDLLVRRHWSPNGADRLHYLARHGFYDGVRFFRVVPGFVAQFGLSGDTAVAAAWRERTIPDDTVRASNRRGTVAFARGGPETRTTQLFVNLKDNPRLDELNGFGFPPVGEVVSGMETVVDSLYQGYGEGPPRGMGPSQDSIRVLGTPYLEREFPELDWVRRASVVKEWK
ncbi:MAG TPA: peptidylprolyl isomerase [Gemmatimonadaceae bacterium]|jgi:peptidyl-prolyl cis-trans isomerase A (cyclophilin A)|nr:peptidylprolyl isomerase [Gemmatimonadaceae bacterium]